MKLSWNCFLIFGICLVSFCSVCLGKHFRSSQPFVHRALISYFSKGLRTIQSRRYRYRSSLRRIVCTTPNITNGYFIKRRDIIWTFYCDPDFKLIGKSKVNCKDGRFNDEIPVCASLYLPNAIYLQ